jgi:hypothetical protein
MDLRPEITLNGENVVEVKRGMPYTDDHATARDVPDGDITDRIPPPPELPIDTSQVGTHIVTYNVEDSAGQKADQRTRVVRVVPDEGIPDLRPEITLLGDNVVEVERICDYEEPGATAYDKEDGDLDLTPEIGQVGPVKTVERGIYTVTYAAKDSADQWADPRTRTVRVADGSRQPRTRSAGDVVVALVDNEEERDSGDRLEYTAWFMNFGAEDVEVTATLDFPRGVSPIEGSGCGASSCTTRVVVSAHCDTAWTVPFVVDADATSVIIATMTMEGYDITLHDDQEPTVIGSDR